MRMRSRENLRFPTRLDGLTGVVLAVVARVAGRTRTRVVELSLGLTLTTVLARVDITVIHLHLAVNACNRKRSVLLDNRYTSWTTGEILLFQAERERGAEGNNTYAVHFL